MDNKKEHIHADTLSQLCELIRHFEDAEAVGVAIWHKDGGSMNLIRSSKEEKKHGFSMKLSRPRMQKYLPLIHQRIKDML